MAGDISNKSMKYRDGFAEKWMTGGFGALTDEDKAFARTQFKAVFDVNQQFIAGTSNLQHTFQNIFINGQPADERYAQHTQGLNTNDRDLCRMCAFYYDTINRSAKSFAINSAFIEQEGLKTHDAERKSGSNKPVPPYVNPITRDDLSQLNITMEPDPDNPQPAQTILGMEWLFDLFAAFGWVKRETTVEQKCAAINDNSTYTDENEQDAVDKANLTRETAKERYATENLRAEQTKEEQLSPGQKIKQYSEVVADVKTTDAVPRVTGRARREGESVQDFEARVSAKIREDLRADGKSVGESGVIAANWLKDGTDRRRRTGETDNDYNMRLFKEKAAFLMDRSENNSLSSADAIEQVKNEYVKEIDQQINVKNFHEKVAAAMQTGKDKASATRAVGQEYDMEAINLRKDYKTLPTAQISLDDVTKIMDEKLNSQNEFKTRKEQLTNILGDEGAAMAVAGLEQAKREIASGLLVPTDPNLAKTSTEHETTRKAIIEEKGSSEQTFTRHEKPEEKNVRIFNEKVAALMEQGQDKRTATREALGDFHREMTKIEEKNKEVKITSTTPLAEIQKINAERTKSDQALTARVDELTNRLLDRNAANVIAEYEKMERDLKSGLLVPKVQPQLTKTTVSVDELPGNTAKDEQKAVDGGAKQTATKVGKDVSDEITGKANEKTSKIIEKPPEEKDLQKDKGKSNT
ncbi:MAG: hypothetical protein FWH20_06435 [Oscillospiraceae bacterium]|nr:hypothetical protein [Oscillospiraceae bacterium]